MGTKPLTGRLQNYTVSQKNRTHMPTIF